jgi:peptidoglycan/LPS O-acetylase OafA/YrhL
MPSTKFRQVPKDGGSKLPHLTYLPVLDGIRGLGVVLVILYHAGVAGMSGNYLMIDVFFVLSGFLITSLLITDRKRNKTVSFSAFYARRARRLFPALFSALILIMIFEAIWGNRAELGYLADNATAILFYVYNWYLVGTHSNYFGFSLIQTPFEHLWTLAIEEQFYLVWPLVIFLVLKKDFRVKRLLAISAFGAIACAIFMFIVYGNGSEYAKNAAYYSTETRGEALLVGCSLSLLFTFLGDREKLPNKVWVEVLGYVGLAGITVITSLASGPPSWMFRGGFFAGDLATAMVIGATTLRANSLMTRFFSLWPLVNLGKISYGAYIWSLPLILLFEPERVGFGGWEILAVRLSSILAISVISYFVLENPIRRGKRLINKTPFIVTPTVIISSFVLFVTIGQMSAPSIGTVSNKFATVPSALKKDPIRVLITGDSIPYTLAVGLIQRETYFGLHIYDGAILGCGVYTDGIINVDGNITPETGYPVPCNQKFSYYKSEMKKYKPDVSVLMAGGWEVLPRSLDGGKTWLLIGNSYLDSQIENGLKTAISILHEGGVPVVLLTTPYFDEPLLANGQVPVRNNKKLVNIFNSLLYKVAKTEGPWLHIINLNAKVDPGGNFAEYIDGVQIRDTDGIHFSYPPKVPYSNNYPDGGWWLAPWLLPQLEQIGYNYRTSIKK